MHLRGGWSNPNKVISQELRSKINKKVIESVAGIIYDARRLKAIDTHDPWGVGNQTSLETINQRFEEWTMTRGPKNYPIGFYLMM